MARLLSRSDETRKKEVGSAVNLFHVKHLSSSPVSDVSRETLGSSRLFHVKHLAWVDLIVLFSYAEFPEDDVQDVLDVDPPQ